MNIRHLLISATLVVAFLLGGLFAVARPTEASNQWSNWHWRRTGDRLYLRVQDTTSSTLYPRIVAEAVANWNYPSHPLVLYLRPYCITIFGWTLCFHSIHAESGYYGSTGWRGLATLNGTDGDHITHAKTQLNNSYIASDPDTDKLHVACQEIGHDLGLDHRVSSDSCMVSGGSGAYPDSHDYSVLGSITHQH